MTGSTPEMEKQVNSIYKSCYYQLRNIGFTHKHRNEEICKTLVRTLVISWLDHGNASLFDVFTSDKLLTASHVQNCAARLALTKGATLFQLSSSSLYKALNRTAPAYLTDLGNDCILQHMGRNHSTFKLVYYHQSNFPFMYYYVVVCNHCLLPCVLM